MVNSNTILVVLAVVAIVTAIGGAVVILENVPLLQLTGAATPGVSTSGTLSITLGQEVQINLSQDTINFGAGRVFGNCTTWTGSTQHATDNTSCGNWSYAPLSPFTVENTGNLDVNVSIKSQYNASDVTNWLGGAGSSQKYMAINNEANSCINLSSTVGWLEFYDYDRYVCNNLSWNNSKDTIDIEINLTVAYDSRTGSVNNVITFTAEQA
jgi:hypothetical protein